MTGLNSNCNRYIGLFVLSTFNLTCLLDRISISVILEQIQDYFRLSSAQAGLLATFYPVGLVLCTPLFGYLGDRYSRKWIIIYCVLFWNLSMLAITVLTPELYYLLFLARLLMGMGASGASTVAPTLIADLFASDRRKFALSAYYTTSPLGMGLAYLMGTLVLSVGEWRVAFWLTPIVAALMLLLLLFFKEPHRGSSDGLTTEEKDTESVYQNLGYLWTRRSFVLATIGYTATMFYEGGFSWWLVSFMTDTFEGENNIPAILGLIILVGGLSGVNLGTLITQYFNKFDGRTDPIFCALAIFLASPMLATSLMIAKLNASASWIIIFLATMCLATLTTPQQDMVNVTTRPSKRSFASSVQQFSAHLAGTAAGPVVIGIIKDQLERFMDDKYQAFLLAVLYPLFVLLFGGAAYIWAARYYLRDKKDLEKYIMERETPTKKPLKPGLAKHSSTETVTTMVNVSVV